MTESSGPTHAGAIVARLEDGRPVYLLVSTRRSEREWVFPKGHIEPDETSGEAAVRELHEEAGAVGTIVSSLGIIESAARGAPPSIEYFLLRLDREGTGGEGREVRWGTYDDVRRRLTFADARLALERAHPLAIAALGR